jgi:hypothetical protein
VVLRLGGRTSLGATFFVGAADYARRLEAVGGRLYLSGVESGSDRADRTHRPGRCHGPSAGLRSDRLTGEPRSPLTTPPRHGWSDQTAAINSDSLTEGYALSAVRRDITPWG